MSKETNRPAANSARTLFDRVTAGKWSESDKQRLCDMHRDGVPIADIAATLGRSYAACQQWIKDLRKQGVELPSRLSTARRVNLDPIFGETDHVRRTAASTDAHLVDLQNSGGAWKTHNIPAERTTYYARQTDLSGCGSPAGMCAEVGGAG